MVGFFVNKKARIIDSESAGVAASYDNNRALMEVESTAGSSSAHNKQKAYPSKQHPNTV